LLVDQLRMNQVLQTALHPLRVLLVPEQREHAATPERPAEHARAAKHSACQRIQARNPGLKHRQNGIWLRIEAARSSRAHELLQEQRVAVSLLDDARDGAGGYVCVEDRSDEPRGSLLAQPRQPNLLDGPTVP